MAGHRGGTLCSIFCRGIALTPVFLDSQDLQTGIQAAPEFHSRMEVVGELHSYMNLYTQAYRMKASASAQLRFRALRRFGNSKFVLGLNAIPSVTALISRSAFSFR